MKRFTLLVIILIFFACGNSFADPKIIDLSDMTVKELNELIAEIKEEREGATEASKNVKKQLQSDFKQYLVSIAPEGASIKYPLLHLAVIS